MGMLGPANDRWAHPTARRSGWGTRARRRVAVKPLDALAVGASRAFSPQSPVDIPTHRNVEVALSPRASHGRPGLAAPSGRRVQGAVEDRVDGAIEPFEAAAPGADDDEVDERAHHQILQEIQIGLPGQLAA